MGLGLKKKGWAACEAGHLMGWAAQKRAAGGAGTSDGLDGLTSRPAARAQQLVEPDSLKSCCASEAGSAQLPHGALHRRLPCLATALCCVSRRRAFVSLPAPCNVPADHHATLSPALITPSSTLLPGLSPLGYLISSTCSRHCNCARTKVAAVMYTVTAVQCLSPDQQPSLAARGACSHACWTAAAGQQQQSRRLLLAVARRGTSQVSNHLH